MRRSIPFFALLATLISMSANPLQAQEEKPDYAHAFRVYTSQGEPASLDDILAAMDETDAVLVGETHTDPVAHWLEAELFRMAVEHFRAGGDAETSPGALRPVALSLEMFERDVQYILDEYLADLITEQQFLASARPWEHYEEDYRPMVELARERGLPVIAANAPRRYVNRVSRLGREALRDLAPRARSFLPPLPYPQPTEAYRAEWMGLMSNMTMEDQCPVPELPPEHPPMGDTLAAHPPMIHPAQPDSGATGHPVMPPTADRPAGMDMPPGEEDAPPSGMPSHGMGNFMENGLQAQTLWDSSMGYAMATYLEMNPGALVVHMVGGFHVENHTGTPEKLAYYRPKTRILVVATEPVEDVNAFDPEEHAGKGDFVILTDEALDLYVARNCGPQAGGG
jgi:uncharacterized iron-regulated protein